jgi:DNA-binding beta-propeller fold protein YncE
MEAPMTAFRRLALPVCVSLAAFSFGIPAPACAELVRIYVTNSAGDSVDVVDPATNKVVQEFKGPEAMHGVAFSPDGARVYVSNEHERTLDVFDRLNGKLVKQVQLSDRPNNIAVATDGRIVVGIARGRGALDIIDPGTLERRASIPVNGRLHNVYVTADSKYVITGSIPNKVITVIDLATERVAWELQLDKGVRPMAIESNPDGSPKRIFAQLSELNGFAVVDFAARKEVARIVLPKTEVTFESDPGRDTSPSHGIGVAPDGKTLWVTSIPNNSVFVYSLADLKQIGEVALPALRVPGREQMSSVPNWVTFTPDSRTIYISNAAMRAVTAIDTASMTVKALIPVGEVPKRINTLVMK